MAEEEAKVVREYPTKGPKKQIDMVQDMYKSCKSVKELAAKVNTTENSIRWYMSKLNIRGYPRIKKEKPETKKSKVKKK